MNMVLSAVPVVFINPITDKIEVMPVEMICAYVAFPSDLNLEEAARVAAIRDDEAATNLLLSMDIDTEYQTEGTETDRLAVPIV